MRWVTPVALAGVDAGATVACLVLSIWLRDTTLPALHLASEFRPVRDYATLWPALGLLLATRWAVGLYPGYGRTAPEELRLQSVATVLVIIFVFTGSALFRFSGTYSRFVLAATAVLAAMALPVARALAKQVLSRSYLYGRKVAVIGRSPRTEQLRTLLTNNPTLGFRPVEPAGGAADLCLLVPDELEAPLPDMLDELTRRFDRVLLAPDLLDVASVWVTPRDVSGHLALELRNNLLLPANRVAKRSLDLTLGLGFGILAVPLLILVGAAVLATSGFPILIRQRRVGRNGREFWLYKFRTMHRDAEAQLAHLLATDESARREWEVNRKLKRDPRVTPLGRFLRAASLDELPQLLNVLRGDMSLVGPRPIVQSELALYRDKARLYLEMRPGLTGLMQVSGRNDLDYDERVRLDAYYVRNWSVWLDLVVLTRTFAAVARGDGAY